MLRPGRPGHSADTDADDVSTAEFSLTVTKMVLLISLRNRPVTPSLRPATSPPGPIKSGWWLLGDTTASLPATGGRTPDVSRSPDKLFEEYM
ncbi:hypothetical protein GCM10023200_06690 [Actinomycetospora chlora]|uniref:Uncharacterized protein n=1 Tax=Actinomycetospora chlora TaxID=663608 RepID=A0ABP9A9H5_9PSEU